MPKRHSQTAKSNTYRFFVEPQTIQGQSVRIDDTDLAHQLSGVLRLAAGDQVVLLDNSGWQYTVAFERFERNSVLGSVVAKTIAPGEPRTHITLYLALMRPERFEWALQKGTELGVTSFVPVFSDHSLVSETGDIGERKMTRWSKIIREAAEQSRRGKLPQLFSATPFAQACEQAISHDLALLLWEGDGVQSLRSVLANHTPAQHAIENRQFSIAVISGPEGGWSEKELETAGNYGIIPITLGPRTLRAETAPLAATTAILYQLGDLD